MSKKGKKAQEDVVILINCVNAVYIIHRLCYCWSDKYNKIISIIIINKYITYAIYNNYATCTVSSMNNK